MDATIAACEGCDAIVHYGGASSESPWQTILDASIRGSYHVYEGARKHGVKRVVYASSVHAIGYHEIESHIGVDAPVRPDSLYGVSKTFVGSLSRLNWDKFGIESVRLRIFSSLPEPTERRMLWSYLSFADCVRLTERTFPGHAHAHDQVGLGVLLAGGHRSPPPARCSRRCGCPCRWSPWTARSGLHRHAACIAAERARAAPRRDGSVVHQTTADLRRRPRRGAPDAVARAGSGDASRRGHRTKRRFALPAPWAYAPYQAA